MNGPLHPIILLGICAIVGGVLLLVLYHATAPVRYEDPVHERPAEMKAWHVDPVPQPGRHRAEENLAVLRWRFVLATDSYVLLDKDYNIVYRIQTDDWYYRRGEFARDLFVNGFPMIPDDVIDYTSER